MYIRSSNLSLRARMVKAGKESSTKGLRAWEGQIEPLEHLEEVKTDI